MPLNSDERLARIKRHLPRSQDLTLLVLKGHLLVEEQLERILESHCSHASELADARLTFRQKLQLVRALTGTGLLDAREGRFIEKLNSVRNKMAHRLDGFDGEGEIAGLLEFFADHDTPNPRDLPLRQKLSWLRSTIAIVCGILEGFCRGYLAAKAQGERR
jgi:uncharacterized protein YutE (UPF0331/DUF86 family)